MILPCSCQQKRQVGSMYSRWLKFLIKQHYGENNIMRAQHVVCLSPGEKEVK